MDDARQKTCATCNASHQITVVRVLRCMGCVAKPNLCRLCGHEIYSHDRQYGCSEDGCDCETPNPTAKRAPKASG